jgi:GNAT superfamily N-acetyltransferase
MNDGPGGIAIVEVGTATRDARELTDELDLALDGPYSEDQHHGLDVEDLFQPHIRFFIAYLDGVAVGCGGVALFEDYAEIKRMYARASVRGRGVARALLHRIEAATRDVGLAVLRLETGVFQQDALRFYERAGFRQRGPFGAYAEMPARAIAASAFYEKPV